MLKICLKCLRQSLCLKNPRNWISLMCQQKHQSLPMQKPLQRREKVCHVCASNNCFIQRTLNSDMLLLLQFLKNLWKLDSEVKNLIDYYIATMDYNHSLETFSHGLLKVLVYSLLTPAACKEPSSWSLSYVKWFGCS